MASLVKLDEVENVRLADTMYCSAMLVRSALTYLQKKKIDPRMKSVMLWESPDGNSRNNCISQSSVRATNQCPFSKLPIFVVIL